MIEMKGFIHFSMANPGHFHVGELGWLNMPVETKGDIYQGFPEDVEK